MLFIGVIISFASVSANLNTFSSISPWSIFTVPSSSPTSISILNSPLDTEGIESIQYDLKTDSYTQLTLPTSDLV